MLCPPRLDRSPDQRVADLRRDGGWGPGGSRYQFAIAVDHHDGPVLRLLKDGADFLGESLQHPLRISVVFHDPVEAGLDFGAPVLRDRGWRLDLADGRLAFQDHVRQKGLKPTGQKLNDQPGITQLQGVARRKGRGLGGGRAIENRPVRAEEILNPPSTQVAIESSVLARDPPIRPEIQVESHASTPTDQHLVAFGLVYLRRAILVLVA